MTDPKNRKSAAASRRNQPSMRTYSVSIGNLDSGFEFKVEITVSGRTPSSSSMVKDMPPLETIWSEAQRKEWLAKVIEHSKIGNCDGVKGRICDGYVAMLSAMLELNDSIGVERAAAKPKPQLRIVGGYEAAMPSPVGRKATRSVRRTEADR